MLIGHCVNGPDMFIDKQWSKRDRDDGRQMERMMPADGSRKGKKQTP